MSDTEMERLRPDLADELAYVRSLAEEGRDAPLVGGFYYLLWGGLMGLAALFCFAVTSGFAPLGRAGIMGPWIVGGLIGWGVTFLRRKELKPGALTLGNRAASATWFAVGVFMTVFWVTLMVVHDNFTRFGVPPYFMFTIVFPVAFGLYGVAFYATAAAARMAWLKYFAFLSWAFCVAAMLLIGSDMQFLLGAAGCFLCAALPGFLVMRAEPQEIV